MRAIFYVPLEKSLSAARIFTKSLGVSPEEAGAGCLMVTKLFWPLCDVDEDDDDNEDDDGEEAGDAIPRNNKPIKGPSSSTPKAAARSSGDIAVNHCRTPS